MINNKILNLAKKQKENASHKVNPLKETTASNHQLSWRSFFINGKQTTDDFMNDSKDAEKLGK